VLSVSTRRSLDNRVRRLRRCGGMPRLAALLVLLALLALVLPATAQTAAGEPEKREALARRIKIRTYHRSMGITTWLSLGATATIGTIRYANVIGFGKPLCQGDSPIFGRTYGCGDGLHIQHVVSASFTTLSYITTRTLAALMPDPYDAAASRPGLAAHRALSWVHLAGMIAMPILGVATARTTDQQTRESLAAAHLVVGYTTFASVSAAAAIMVF
jgi:hypothetical protein